MDDELVSLSALDQQFLLGLARGALQQYLLDGGIPEIEVRDLTPGVQACGRCFVTLRDCEGGLRGCVGHMSTTEPLYVAVIESAIAAATRDGRFLPVHRSELPHLSIKISVLAPSRRLACGSPDELRKLLSETRCGVTLRNGWRSAVYLPQVWRTFADEEDPVDAFLTSLSLKAGDYTGELWRQPETEFEVFEAMTFGEGDRDED